MDILLISNLIKKYTHKDGEFVLNSNLQPHRGRLPVDSQADRLEIAHVASSPFSLSAPKQGLLNPCYPACIDTHYFNAFSHRQSMLPWTSPMSTHHRMSITNPMVPSLAILAIRVIQRSRPFNPIFVERSINPFYKNHPISRLPMSIPMAMECTNYQRKSKCGLLSPDLVQHPPQPPSHMHLNQGSVSNQQDQSLNYFPGSLGPSTTRKYRQFAFNDDQKLALEEEFRINPYPTRRRCIEIARDLCVRETQIVVWFSRRRAKEKELERKRKNEKGLELRLC